MVDDTLGISYSHIYISVLQKGTVTISTTDDIDKSVFGIVHTYFHSSFVTCLLPAKTKQYQPKIGYLIKNNMMSDKVELRSKVGAKIDISRIG